METTHQLSERAGHINFWAESLVPECQSMNSLVKWLEFTNLNVLWLQANKHASARVVWILRLSPCLPFFYEMQTLVWNNLFSLKSVISLFNKHVADQTDACCKNLEKATKAEKHKGTFFYYYYFLEHYLNTNCHFHINFLLAVKQKNAP